MTVEVPSRDQLWQEAATPESDIWIREWKNRDRRFSEAWATGETLPRYLFLKGGDEAEGPRRSWAVLVGNRVVGRMMLRDWRDTPAKSARLGTYFGPCDRRGFGREAYKLFLATVPQQFGLVWVYGDIHEDNVIALNLSRKSGFVVCGEDYRKDQAGNIHKFHLVEHRVVYACTQ